MKEQIKNFSLRFLFFKNVSKIYTEIQKFIHKVE